jgi:hypothetical protein
MSPPGMAAAGFALRSRRCPRSRPCTVRQGRGARRPSRRSWTGSARAQHAEATVPAGAGPALPTSPGTRCAYRARRPGSSHRRRWSTTSRRTVAIRSSSGTRATGRGCASPVMTPRRRARAAGADCPRRGAPGGRSFVASKGRQGPGGPSPVHAREIREGGTRALSGGIRGFLPAEARRFGYFCEVLTMDDLAIAWRRLGELIPYARNPRTHTDGQVAQIAARSGSSGGRIRCWSMARAGSSPDMAGCWRHGSSGWSGCR